MKPQEQEQTPAFELPPAQKAPSTQETDANAQNGAYSEQQHATKLEQGALSQGSVSGASAQDGQVISTPGSDGTVAPQTAAQPNPAITTTPQIADDNDLIEKEWVLKAKEIVEQTAHDPHLQNKKMNRFKADYLKKRYNKDIKLTEDA